MNRLLLGTCVVLMLGVSCSRLWSRWREEALDHRVTLVVDWAEAHDAAARQHLTDDQLLLQLHDAGASAILIGAATVQDYLLTNPSGEQSNLVFANRVAAETVFRQLHGRAVAGVSLSQTQGKSRIHIDGGNWPRLKDLEIGYNPDLLGKARQSGLHLILRINHDPWMTQESLFNDLQEIGSANQVLGVLLNTDEVPGGLDALPQWTSFLESQNFAQLLFEFHPSKSSVKLGFRSPQTTYRAHTIASNELRDLSPSQERSRWRRAVEERSCRFLLVHMSPTDAIPGFLDAISAVQHDLVARGWAMSWPSPRANGSIPSFAERRLAPVLALLLAIILPVMALQSGLRRQPWTSYIEIIALIFVSASLVAAVAQNSWTRLELVPFRGIKLAFALAWLGSFGVLFPWKWLKSELYQSVRRIDILACLAVLAVIGYLLIRTGNASAGWKVDWEQGLRDRLEDLLIARPRFKEFVIGYPLLFLGLHLRSAGIPKRVWQDGRLWIWLGMIGPISTINTFCHLHSPLYLAYWRSFNGILLGTLIGGGLLLLQKWKGVSPES